MNGDHYFCSEASREEHESPIGTASTGRIWVLLEYAGAWGKMVPRDSSLPVEVKQWWRETRSAHPAARLLLIKQHDSRPVEAPTLFVALADEIDPKLLRADLKTYRDISQFDLTAAMAENSTLVFREAAEHYFACTHGTHDRCCAKWGRPIYDALRGAIPKVVWQVSHVGGDRFAGNLVCFPSSVFYGHVSSATASAIVDATENGQIYLSNYRGRACYAREAQVGEYYARLCSGVLGVDALRLASITQDASGNWIAKFLWARDAATLEVSFRTESDARPRRLTCTASEARAVLRHTLLSYIRHSG